MAKKDEFAHLRTLRHTEPEKGEDGLWYFEVVDGKEVVGRSSGFKTKKQAQAVRDGAEEHLDETVR